MYFCALSRPWLTYWPIFTFFSAKKVGSGDILCEMRFHVPNNELELYQEEQERQKAKRRADKKAAAAEAGEEEKKGDA